MKRPKMRESLISIPPLAVNGQVFLLSVYLTAGNLWQASAYAVSQDVSLSTDGSYTSASLALSYVCERAREYARRLEPRYLEPQAKGHVLNGGLKIA